MKKVITVLLAWVMLLCVSPLYAETINWAIVHNFTTVMEGSDPANVPVNYGVDNVSATVQAYADPYGDLKFFVDVAITNGTDNSTTIYAGASLQNQITFTATSSGTISYPLHFKADFTRIPEGAVPEGYWVSANEVSIDTSIWGSGGPLASTQFGQTYEDYDTSVEGSWLFSADLAAGTAYTLYYNAFAHATVLSYTGVSSSSTVSSLNSFGFGGNFWDQVRGTASITDGAGHSYVGTSEVPEPHTLFLLASGLIGLAGYGRKKFFKK